MQSVIYPSLTCKPSTLTGCAAVVQPSPQKGGRPLVHPRLCKVLSALQTGGQASPRTKTCIRLELYTANKLLPDLHIFNIDWVSCSSSAQSPEARQTPGASTSVQSPTSTQDSLPGSQRDRDSPASVSLQMKQQYSIANQRTPPTPDVRLYHRAVVVAQDTPGMLPMLFTTPTTLTS